MAFSLHADLARDGLFVADLEFCRVLLMKNANYPWLLLVPLREGARELFDLSQDDYNGVMHEVREVTMRFAKLTGAYKMNVATLGNVTPQMHIHVIARFQNDTAWPMPVWGKESAAYTPEALETMRARVLYMLQEIAAK